MAFDQSTITAASGRRDGSDYLVTWESTAPADTFFQIYLDGVLAWAGRGLAAKLPYPPDGAKVDVGAVAAGEATADLSATLPASPLRLAVLVWTGGTYLGADLTGYNVYQGLTAGGAVSYATRVDYVPAYAAGIPTDGFGMGGFGMGGFGQASADYRWQSGVLGTGTWNFGVKPVDVYGNEGTAVTGFVAIVAPPGPPAVNAAGARVTYVYDPALDKATLLWLSPA